VSDLPHRSYEEIFMRVKFDLKWVLIGLGLLPMLLTAVSLLAMAMGMDYPIVVQFIKFTTTHLGWSLVLIALGFVLAVGASVAIDHQRRKR
jgi:hypothetical protein